MKRSEFFDRLKFRYTKIPEEGIIAENSRAISHWHITAKDLDRLYEAIMEQCHFYPSLSEMKQIAAELDLFAPKSERRPAHFQLFSVNGVRYARKITEPSDPPMTPAGASDVHIAVDRPAKDPFEGEHEPTTEEKRAWFKEGWVESGADSAKADAIFYAIEQQKPVAPLLISDFDDSPAALGIDMELEALEKAIDG